MTEKMNEIKERIEREFEICLKERFYNKKSNDYIKIKNFGPVKDATIEIKPFLVLIGGQGIGKSTVAKLLYPYFRIIYGI